MKTEDAESEGTESVPVLLESFPALAGMGVSREGAIMGAPHSLDFLYQLIGPSSIRGKGIHRQPW